MDQTQDNDLPDKETERMPIAASQPAPEPPTPPVNSTLAIEDAETARIPTPDTSDSATIDTVRIPATSASDPSVMDTVRVPAVVVKEDSKATAIADAPTRRLPAAPATLLGRVPRFVWLRYPEFWLAIALAAFLRLWHIELAAFLDDQTTSLRLARGAWLYHALPVTGIPSSIGTLNPPLNIYLLMPFTLFSKDPLPATISIALWNVLGVALCYIFAQRYFGRFIAGSGALLFATCGVAVNFSRFIWQPNYLPPVLVLWMLTLYLGCVNGRRRWFVPHVVLLTIAILLHSTAAFLIPVSLVGLLLTPRQAMPTRWEWPIATGLVLLLLAPTVLWEAISRGSDLRVLVQYMGHSGSFNLDVFHMIYSVLGAPWLGKLGPQSLYAQIGSWATALNVIAVVCFVAGMAVLTERLLRVGRYIWREGSASATGRTARLRRGMAAIWRGLRAEPIWRAHLLLWLWVVVPVVLMLRHNSALPVHYLIVLYPAAFIAGGFAFQAAFRLAGRLMPRATATRRLARAAIVAFLALVVLAQAIQSALFPVALASGSFDAFTSYGYPLAETQQLDAALATLQTEQDARAVFVSMPEIIRYQFPLEYLAMSEHPDRIGFAANCLVLPAPDEEPALVVATQPAGPANTLLASLPELTPVANLEMAGSDAVAVYQMAGKLPPLLGERTLTPVTFTDAAGNGLRLDAVAQQPDGLIRLRWTVLGSATTSQGTPSYRISSSVRSANGSTRALPYTDCQPTRWHAGETVFTWASGGAANAQALQVQVHGSMHILLVRSGRVRVLTGGTYNTPPALLRPSSGTMSADGTLTIPLVNTP